MRIRWPPPGAIGGQRWVPSESIGGLNGLEVPGQAQDGRERLRLAGL
jgi:hypothetical protein